MVRNRRNISESFRVFVCAFPPEIFSILVIGSTFLFPYFVKLNLIMYVYLTAWFVQWSEDLTANLEIANSIPGISKWEFSVSGLDLECAPEIQWVLQDSYLIEK